MLAGMGSGNKIKNSSSAKNRAYGRRDHPVLSTTHFFPLRSDYFAASHPHGHAVGVVLRRLPAFRCGARYGFYVPVSFFENSHSRLF
jgi:hypothetical protein